MREIVLKTLLSADLQSTQQPLWAFDCSNVCAKWGNHFCALGTLQLILANYCFVSERLRIDEMGAS